MGDKKMGRPTDDPKTLSTRIRLSQEDIYKLNIVASTLNITKAEVIRKGIDKIYLEIKK